jgi:hypothetical protein
MITRQIALLLHQGSLQNYHNFIEPKISRYPLIQQRGPTVQKLLVCECSILTLYTVNIGILLYYQIQKTPGAGYLQYIN